MSASRSSVAGLVGRPLVPYFDASEEVNEKLVIDASAPVEAPVSLTYRTWNAKDGYFEEAKPAAPSPPCVAVPPPVPIIAASPSFSSAPATPPSSAPSGGPSVPSSILLTPSALLSAASPAGARLTPAALEKSKPVQASPCGVRGGSPPQAQTKPPPHTPGGKPGKKGKAQLPPDPPHTQSIRRTASASAGHGRSGADLIAALAASIPSSGPSPVKSPAIVRTESVRQPRKKAPAPAVAPVTSAGTSEFFAWSAFQCAPDPSTLPIPHFD